MAGLHGTAGSDYFGQISANAQTSFKSPFDLGIALKKGYCCSGLVQMANGVNLAPFSLLLKTIVVQPLNVLSFIFLLLSMELR